MPLDRVERILDQAAAMNPMSIVFTGGEPLVYPWFKETLRMCQERKLRTKIATNGLLLDDAHIAMLLEYEVYSLQISLDTLDPVYYATIKGCTEDVHRRVMEGIERCVKTKQLHLAVSSVVARPLCDDWRDIMRYCHDVGADTFTLYHVIPYGRASQNAYETAGSMFETVADDLCGVFESLPQHWAVDTCVPCAERSAFLALWKDRLDIQNVSCKAGKRMMMILVNGDGVPCSCIGDPLFTCGNVFQMPLQKMWNAPIMRYFRGEQAIEDCEKCDSFSTCLNGCRTLGYLATGRIDGFDPICKIWNSLQPK